jgi:hypothetical protein
MRIAYKQLRNPPVLENPKILQPLVGRNSSASMPTALRAYFMYMGRTARSITVSELRFSVTVAGAGAQTAEAALYSSPAQPAGALQDLTRIGAGVGTITSLTTTGAKVATLNQVVAEGVYLWAAVRINMATTMPTVLRSMFDDGGLVLHSFAAPGALTAAASVLVAAQTNPSFNNAGLNLILVAT